MSSTTKGRERSAKDTRSHKASTTCVPAYRSLSVSAALHGAHCSSVGVCAGGPVACSADTQSKPRQRGGITANNTQHTSLDTRCISRPGLCFERLGYALNFCQKSLAFAAVHIWHGGHTLRAQLPQLHLASWLIAPSGKLILDCRPADHHNPVVHSKICRHCSSEKQTRCLG